MTFEKQTSDRYDIINSDGMPAAYIEKNYVGTHGHWKGWEHYIYCPERQEYLLPCVSARIVYKGKNKSVWEPWVDAPQHFNTVKEAKLFWERKSI